MEGRAVIESIHKRIGHIVVSYKYFVLVWSGFVGKLGLTRENLNAPRKLSKKNEKTFRTVRSTYCPTDVVWFYNCHNGMWKPAQTTGDIPQKTSGSSAAVLDDYLYIFGGMKEFGDDDDERHRNDLYRLHLPSLVWEKLSPRGPKPPHSDKGVGWAFNGKLYFFGGYGPRPDPSTMDFVFQADIANTNGRLGWNNNFFAYDPTENVWFKPNTKGRTPEPRAAHSASVVSNRAFIFGGRRGEMRTNDLYYINLDTLTWSQNINDSTRNIGPEGRSWLSFNFVSRKKAVVYGGLRQYGIAAMDYWECEFADNYESLEWTKCESPIEPRVWHQAAFCEYTGELVIIGGVRKSPYDMEEEDHTRITFLKYYPDSFLGSPSDAEVDLNTAAHNISEETYTRENLQILVFDESLPANCSQMDRSEVEETPSASAVPCRTCGIPFIPKEKVNTDSAGRLELQYTNTCLFCVPLVANNCNSDIIPELFYEPDPESSYYQCANTATRALDAINIRFKVDLITADENSMSDFTAGLYNTNVTAETDFLSSDVDVMQSGDEDVPPFSSAERTNTLTDMSSSDANFFIRGYKFDDQKGDEFSTDEHVEPSKPHVGSGVNLPSSETNLDGSFGSFESVDLYSTPSKVNDSPNSYKNVHDSSFISLESLDDSLSHIFVNGNANIRCFDESVAPVSSKKCDHISMYRLEPDVIPLTDDPCTPTSNQNFYENIDTRGPDKILAKGFFSNDFGEKSTTEVKDGAPRICNVPELKVPTEHHKYTTAVSPVKPTLPTVEINLQPSHANNPETYYGSRNKSPFRYSLRVKTPELPSFKSYITPESSPSKNITPKYPSLEGISGSRADSSKLRSPANNTFETPRSHKPKPRTAITARCSATKDKSCLSSPELHDIVIIEPFSAYDSENYITPTKMSSFLTSYDTEKLGLIAGIATETVASVSPVAVQTFSAASNLAAAGLSGGSWFIATSLAAIVIGGAKIITTARDAFEKLKPLVKSPKM